MGRRHTIGPRNLAAICQISEADRTALLAEGMPVILASAESAWEGARALVDRPREAEVLEGLAAEEAAKILILVDLYRCPAARRAEVVGKVARRFYDHLARLIYANAVRWRPVTKAELRSYVDGERRSHVVDGPFGEWIMASGPVVERERRLYGDVERFDDGALVWSEPRGLPVIGAHRPPPAVSLVLAMRNLGLLTAEGLKAIARVWGTRDLTDDLDHREARDLKRKTLEDAEATGVIPATASDDDVRTLYELWAFPMWDFDFHAIEVPLEELEEERDRNLANEMGGW